MAKVGGDLPVDDNGRAAMGLFDGTKVRPVLGDALGNLFGIYAPPSAGAGRTHVDAGVYAQTADSLVYTVTPGKMLNVLSMTISAFNLSLASIGDLRIRDNTVDKKGIVLSTAPSGAPAASSGSNQWNFPEPIQFATSVRVHIQLGTLTYTFSVTGYEQ